MWKSVLVNVEYETHEGVLEVELDVDSESAGQVQRVLHSYISTFRILKRTNITITMTAMV
jgi:hypothetical protein